MEQKMRFFAVVGCRLSVVGNSIKNYGVFDSHNFLWTLGGGRI